MVNEYFLLLVLEKAGDDWICAWVFVCLNWVVRSKLELWMEKSSFWVSSSLDLRESTSVSRRSTITPSRVLKDLLILALEWSSLMSAAVLFLLLIELVQGVPLGLLVVMLSLVIISWSGGWSRSSSGAESSSSSSSSSESIE